ESAWVPNPHGHRLFKSERIAAAVPRFLPDAGCLGIDGPAVDIGRSRADAVDQPRQLCPIPHRLYPGLPFRAAKERVRRPSCHGPTAPPRNPPITTTPYTQQYNTNNA